MTWAKINYVYICQCLDSLLSLYNISIVVTTQKKNKAVLSTKLPYQKSERECVDKNVKNNR